MQLRTLAFLCLVSLELCAVDYTWIGTGGGSWSNPANWSSSGGTFPNGASDTATFGNAALSPAAIDLGSGSFTVSTITFNSGATQPYTIQNGTLTMAGAALVSAGSTTTQTISALVSGSLGLSVIGTGTTNLITLSNASNNFSGTANISGVNLTIPFFSALGVGDISLSDTTSLTRLTLQNPDSSNKNITGFSFDLSLASGTTTLTGNITGRSTGFNSIRQMGTGDLILNMTATNRASDPIILSLQGGTATVGPNVLSQQQVGSNNMGVNAGTTAIIPQDITLYSVALTGNLVINSGVTYSGNSISLTGTASTISVATGANLNLALGISSSTLPSSISTVKTGAGTVSMSNCSAFIAFQEGTLQANNQNATGMPFNVFQDQPQHVTFSSGTTLRIGANLGTLLGGNGTSIVYSDPAATLTVNTNGFNAGTTTAIQFLPTSGPNTGSTLIKTGLGSLFCVFNATSPAASVVINQGVLSTPSNSITQPITFSSTSSLQLTSATPASSAIALQVDSGTATIDVTNAGSTFPFTAPWTGSGTFEKAGSGILSLNNSTNSTASWGTKLTAGTLLVDATVTAPGIGSGTITFSGGTLKPASVLTFSQPISVSSTGGTLDLSSANTTFSGSISGDGTLTKSGSGIFNLGNSATSGSWNLAVSQGQVTLGAGAAGVSGSISLSNGTTFQFSDSATLSNTINLVSGVATVNVNGQNPSLTGQITGSGGITITGGLLGMGGGGFAPNYSGQTTINSGSTLQALGDSSFSTLSAVAVSSGATLAINSFSSGILSLSDGTGAGTVNLGTGTLSVGSGSFSGTITGGTGGLSKIGSGTLTLGGSGSADYSGNTSIINGTLAAGVMNAFSPFSEVVLSSSGTLGVGANDNTISNLSGTGGTVSLAGGILTAGNGNSTTFGGAFSGTGTFRKIGAGSLTLSGTSTMTGAVEVNAGAVTVSGTINLTGNLDLNAGAVTVSGAVNPTSINVNAGIFTVTGTANATSIDVNAGTLTVNGTVNSTSIDVNGGTLKGAGTISSNIEVHSGATISPGNSIGTLIIMGDLTIDTGSTSVFEISPTNNSLLSVFGTVDIQSGAAVNIIVQSGLYAANTTYTLIASTSLIGDCFSSLTFSNPALQGVITCDPISNRVLLQLLIAAGTIPITDLTGNSLILADYINNLPDSYITAIAPILGPLSGNELDKALMMISPSRNSFATYSAQTAAFSVNQILSTRMSDRRMLPTCIPLCSLCEDEPRPGLIDYFSRPKKSPLCECGSDLLYAAWIDEFGSWSTQEAQEENPAFRFFNGGTLIGLDIGTQDQNVAGLVAGFLRTTIDEYAGYGRQDLTGYLLGGFGTGTYENAYFEGALWGAYYNGGTWRQMTFTGFNQTASDSFHSWQLTPHAEFGFDWGWPGLSLEPYFALDWPIYFQSSYTEHGGGIFDWHVDSHTTCFAQVQLGINAIQTWEFTCFSLLFRQNVGWAHRAVFKTGTVRANFIGVTESFKAHSFGTNQNVGVGAIELYLRTYKGAFFNLEISGEGGEGYANIQCSGMIGAEF